MRLSDFNIIKTNQEIDSIKSDVDAIKTQLNELLVCLPDREKTILDAIETGKQTDLSMADIIEKQEAAIEKLETLNCEKTATLTGLSKWIVLFLLGVLSLSVRYEISYEPGRGAIVKPSPTAGMILPTVYAISIIAIATDQDRKLGLLIETAGKKLGG